MSPGTIHQRLVERALTGKYDLFRGVGGGLAVLGLILFVMALGSDAAPRAWHLFHVNWLYFTGLAGGSVAFVAVQKITNAKWSGLVIRFAEASVAFLPVSLLGLVLIFTLGYHAVYGPMEAAAPWIAAREGSVALAAVHVRPAVRRTRGALLDRLEADPGRPHPRHVRHPGHGRPGSPLAVRPLDPRVRRLPPGGRGAGGSPPPTGPDSTWCCTRSCSPWWRSTASWRCSRTGSATCSAASTSWAPSSAPTCCWR